MLIPESEKCPDCNGTSRVVELETPMGRFEPKAQYRPCPTCKGTGLKNPPPQAGPV
jgi:DnaJ-class molecular chaperone